jgi:hypothetical protein
LVHSPSTALPPGHPPIRGSHASFSATRLLEAGYSTRLGTFRLPGRNSFAAELNRNYEPLPAEGAHAFVVRTSVRLVQAAKRRDGRHRLISFWHKPHQDLPHVPHPWPDLQRDVYPGRARSWDKAPRIAKQVLVLADLD